MQAARGCVPVRFHPERCPARHVTRSTFVIPAQAHRQATHGRGAHRSSRRELVVSKGILEPQDASVTFWYKKEVPGSEFWKELADGPALKEAVLCKDGKFAAIDIFAGWCTSCKNAYPALCKIATSEELRESFSFYKCNMESDPAIKVFLKENGVKGIPSMLVFSPKGDRDFLGRTKPGLVTTLPATFKKMEGVRDSLVIIASNSNTQKYFLDKDTGRVTVG